jgi:hypothetical protein
LRPSRRATAAPAARVAASSLDWTIVRPGSLTDEPGTGRVELSTTLGRRGPVPRDDVAQVLLETLPARPTIRMTFEVFAGDTPVRDAIRNLLPTQIV